MRTPSTRGVIAASLLSLSALTTTASAAVCPIVDATGAFWPLAQRSATMTPAAQTASFHADVASKFPDLYTGGVLGSGNVQHLDELSVHALAAARKNGLRGRTMAQDLTRRLPAFLAHFQKTFPDFRCNFPIYLMASLGSLDGAGRMVAGRPALVIGVDTMAAYETPGELPVVIAHELFHRYNFQAAGFSDDPGDKQAIWRTLWAEGLATYMSGRLNPQASPADVLISPDLAKRGPTMIKRLAQALRDNDAPNPSLYAEYFEGGSKRAESEGIPQRSGYYVGYRVAQLLAKRYSLYRLAHLKGTALHREVNRALAELAKHG
ncbi:MAG: hypothetical protein KGJ79_18770 [Alphaproteobacteria bacterium]|nr:hypothetical protein [Alphaproteobacteria bacterium]MDE2113180.1 hypothetical protein [Alphaproteobacteria bacterium]MDE2494227.1 hypothetical protein [Alphaproteobacteria bacterium]